MCCETIVPENRLALDGKWDIGVGFWFEGALIHQSTELLPLNYQRMLTLGVDYTFGLGNGLHVLSEHFISDASKKKVTPSIFVSRSSYIASDFT